MKIWLINHYAVPPQYYPLSRQYDFAKNLMRSGHEVTIFAASTVHNSSENLITDRTRYREETVDGIHYVYIRCKDYQGNGVSRIYNMCEFAWKLPGVCKKFPRPDAIVSTSVPPTACAAGVTIARRYGIPAVAEIADLWPETFVAYRLAGAHNPIVLALRMLEKRIYKRADAIVFTMEGAYDYIVERGWEKLVPREKVFYINNGVDLERFQTNRTQHVVHDPDLGRKDRFTVVYSGSIRLVNHVEVLVDVADTLQKRGEADIQILLYGAGDATEQICAEIQRRGLKNIQWKGRVEKNQVPSVLSQSNLNVYILLENPLYRFGLSMNKSFEYFASEKPVLASGNSNYSIIDRFHCGECLDTFSAEAMADAIVRFRHMDTATYQAYCEGARKASREFNFVNLTEKLYQVIQYAAKKRKMK